MHGNGNPNWQDKILGGTILGGFVAVAIFAGQCVRMTAPNNHPLGNGSAAGTLLAAHYDDYRPIGESHCPTPAFWRISSISFEASAFVSFSLKASGVPACSDKVFK